MVENNQGTEKDRAIQLFTYLRELAKLRYKTIRNVDDYKDVIWFSDIPKQKECSTPALENKSEYSEWLKIERPNFRPIPPLPEKLRPWAKEEHLGNSSDIPELLNKIPASETKNTQQEVDKDSERDQGPQFIYLSDHPEISTEWEKYLENKWLPWAEENERLKKIQKVYAQLHGIYQQLKRLGEAFEVVVGMGLLTWETPSGQRVRRHLITAHASVEMKDERGTLIVLPGAEGPKLSLEQDMLEGDERPAPETLNDIEQQIKDIADDIWVLSTLTTIKTCLRTWVHAISAEGIYSEELKPELHFPHSPKITFAPALILRRRGERNLINCFEDIKKQVEDGIEVPFNIHRIVEILEDTGGNGQGTSGEREFQDILFPLPTNDEQKKIIEYLRTKRGVLVQGPPGTGKSHTIVNLICHLLATGKRVLVTSQTPRALRVLQGMFPKEIKPLCVSILGNDSEAFKDLQSSVEGITQRHQGWNPEENEERIKRLTKQLDELRRHEAELEGRLREIRERETYEHRICDGAYSGTAQKIAQQIQREHPQYNWLNARVETGESHPLSNQEAMELLALQRELSPALVAEAEQSFVTAEELPLVKDFIALCRAEKDALGRFNDFYDVHQTEVYAQIRLSPIEKLTKVKAALEQLRHGTAMLYKKNQPWVSRALNDILSGRDKSWIELFEFSQKYLKELKKFVKSVEHREIKLPSGYETAKIIKDTKALMEHFNNAGGLGWPFFRPEAVKNAWYLIKNAKVDGQPCNDLETAKKLYNYLMVDKGIESLWLRWSPYVERTPEGKSAQVARLDYLCGTLEEVLKLRPLLAQAKEACLSISGLLPPAWNNEKEIKLYLRAIQAAEAEKALEEVRGKFEKIEIRLQLCSAKSNCHDVVQKILQSVISRDEKAYSVSLEKIEWLSKIHHKILRRNELDNKLKNCAPEIQRQLNNDAHNPCWDERLVNFAQAWRWAQANRWLDEYIGGANEATVVSEFENTQKKIGQTTAQLASLMAWRSCLDQLKEPQRQALKALAFAIRKGKGTGKSASKYRKIAQHLMNTCRSTVPAWIMPLYRVAETVKPGVDSYDVVIIDEASQSGIDALFLLFLAKKIIVVGDDEQISPESIGISRENVDALQYLYLKDFPKEPLAALGVDNSLFDLATILFEGRIVLREHFRCMPEIIQFSNDLCYSNTPLVPLRQYPPHRLEPVKTVHVRDGYRKGESQTAHNAPEAEAVVKTIAQCCKDPRYNGKSMGVISLLGEYHAKMIERMLLEEIDPEEIERRKLVCGDAYAFQGDERDIMFLSMVAARGETEMHALTGAAYRRRFNVAASRARDQMWLFHTPTLNDFRNKECMRYQLLNYCLHPILKQYDKSRERCENDFERAVYDKIVGRGYRVFPQFEMAGYFIDLVVEGRVAVECDGDYWHSDPEQRDHDMRRQRILERCRWTFYRVRGGEFYRNPDAALEGLWKLLARFGIEPEATKDQPVMRTPWQGKDETKGKYEESEKPQGELIEDAEDLTRHEDLLKEKRAFTQTYHHISAPKTDFRSDKNKVIPLRTQRDDELIKWVSSIESEIWFALSHWAKEKGVLKPWERGLAYSIGIYTSKNQEVSVKQARQAHRIYHEAMKKGFKKENLSLNNES